jgi:quercetin dioxygenase-like cupin family protein
MNELKEKKIVKKPWGEEIWFARVPGKYMGKILVINPGEQVSVHCHKNKEETMYVMFGIIELYTVGQNGTIVLEEEKHAEDVLHFEPGMTHSMKCISENCHAVIFEVSTDHPDDSIRIKDFYGRKEDGKEGNGTQAGEA